MLTASQTCNGHVQATVVSPWIVQREALEPFLCAAPPQDPTPQPYLGGSAPRSAPAITMQASIRPAGSEQSFETCRSRFQDVYWTCEQMLAHHTLGGCNIRAGDVIASGTVSSRPDTWHTGRTQGCLLELTENGKTPVELSAGETRTWLRDGDAVEMRAWCGEGQQRVGFGPCDVTVLPAHAFSNAQ